MAMVFLVSACASRIYPGSGRIVDSETSLPIADASVVLDCKRAVSFHNSRTIRTVTVHTDSGGQYRFSPQDVEGCHWGWIHAEKSGYQQLGVGIHVPHDRKAEGGLYLTPDSQANLRRLRTLVLLRQPGKLRGSPLIQYVSLYSDYREGRRIAVTGEETQFVNDNYCSALKSLFLALTDDEKMQMRRYRTPDGSDIDHDKDVEQQCPKA